MLPTPVIRYKLDFLLQRYVDRNYIIEGFTNGFSVNFEGYQSEVEGVNSLTVKCNPGPALQKINSEIQLGRMKGPFITKPFENFKVIPLALREKSTPGKFRLLFNLSYPYDWNAVNLGIDKRFKTVRYASILDALYILKEMPNAYMAKADIKDAFRIIPLRPEEYHLMGCQLQGLYYFDVCLPMGCAASCQIFERFSDSIVWMLKSHFGITSVVKVLDDFLFIYRDFSSCKAALEAFAGLCEMIGVPLAPEKTVGPAKILTFLGIELDSEKRILRLPADKLLRYKMKLQDMLAKDFVPLTDLKSLIGNLQFCTSVVKGGRGFMRRLHNATLGGLQQQGGVFVGGEARKDLKVWWSFLCKYNGVHLMDRLGVVGHHIEIVTDSCKAGFGGFMGEIFLLGSFPEECAQYHITLLELFPIFLFVELMGESFTGQSVLFRCDNAGAVDILNNQTSRDNDIMILVRSIIAKAMVYNFMFSAVHIPGKVNCIADNLSRGQVFSGDLERWGLRQRVLVPGDLPLPVVLTRSEPSL